MAEWNDWRRLIQPAFLDPAPIALRVQVIATFLSIDAGTLHAFAHPHRMAAPGEAARRSHLHFAAGSTLLD